MVTNPTLIRFLFAWSVIAVAACSGASNGGSGGTSGGGNRGDMDGGTSASDGAASGGLQSTSADGGTTVAPEPGLDASGPIAPREAGLQVYPPLKFKDIGKPVTVGSQFLFTEGPIWDPARGVLYFTDINASTIYRLTPPSTFDAFVVPSQNANGLALDPQGHLLAAGFVSRTVERIAGATLNPIATTYTGKKLNSPDDVIARSDGMIYFTDPTFGINGSQGFTAQTPELGFEGVFRLATDGTLHLEDQSTATPNGVELAPDERTLYVSFTTPGTIAKYDVAADGSLSHRSSFATGVPIADSMCVDAGGNLYVASYGGIAIFDPAGTRLGTIAMTQVPTNCAFGGADQKTLYITARTGLTGTPTAGNASLLRIDGMPIPGMPGRP